MLLKFIVDDGFFDMERVDGIFFCDFEDVEL